MDRVLQALTNQLVLAILPRRLNDLRRTYSDDHEYRVLVYWKEVNSMFCPKCGEFVEDGNTCRKCQIVVGLPENSISERQHNVPQASNILNPIGVIILLAGLAVSIYFFLFFDTSVEVPTTELFGQTFGGERVNNLGLMNQRTNGVIIGMGIAIIGLILALATRGKKIS